MRDKKQVMKEEKCKCKCKKCCAGKIFLILAGSAIVLYGIAAFVKRMLESKKKTKVDNGLVYRMFMNGIKEAPMQVGVRTITIQATMSGVDIDLSHLDLSAGLFIRVDAFMSGICIRVPENIQVETDIDSKLSGLSNNIPDYLDTSLPIIHVIGKAKLSGIDIKFVY